MSARESYHVVFQHRQRLLHVKLAGAQELEQVVVREGHVLDLVHHVLLELGKGSLLHLVQRQLLFQGQLAALGFL